MNEEHYRKLERMYLQANVNRMIFDTTKIHISHGGAEVSMEVSDKFHHRAGAMHGAFYFRMLDDAAYFAALSVEHEYFLLTSSFQLHLLRPVASGVIRARGEIRTQTASTFVCTASLLNEKGKEIALGTGTFMKSKMKLSKEIGYE